MRRSRSKTQSLRRSTRRRLMHGLVRLSIIVIVMGASAVGIGLVFSIDRAAIFPASLAGPLPTAPPGIEAISTESGLVWILPAATQAPAPVVFLFHGNGENVAGLLPNAWAYHTRGLAVVMVEYPGYGGTAGSPTQRTVTEAAVDAYDAMAARGDVDTSRAVAHGFSLGGAVAAQLAERRELRGLVLESTFTSMSAMYRSMRIPGFLCRDPFRTDEVLRSFDAPVLLFHGRHDDIVPASHSRKLETIARDATYVEMDGGHNDGPSDPAEYWRQIDSFIERSLGVIVSPAGEPRRSGDGPR